jgi:hypothetical protein
MTKTKMIAFGMLGGVAAGCAGFIIGMLTEKSIFVDELAENYTVFKKDIFQKAISNFTEAVCNVAETAVADCLEEHGIDTDIMSGLTYTIPSMAFDHATGEVNIA